MEFLNAKMEFLKIHVRQQWYANRLYGSTHWRMRNPLKHALQPCFTLHFKNSYVNANINLQSNKIIANILLILIYEQKRSRFGIPNFLIM